MTNRTRHQRELRNADRGLRNGIWEMKHALPAKLFVSICVYLRFKSIRVHLWFTVITWSPKASCIASCIRQDRAAGLRTSCRFLECVPCLRLDSGKRIPFACTNLRFRVCRQAWQSCRSQLSFLNRTLVSGRWDHSLPGQVRLRDGSRPPPSDTPYLPIIDHPLPLLRPASRIY